MIGLDDLLMAVRNWQRIVSNMSFSRSILLTNMDAGDCMARYFQTGCQDSSQYCGQ